MTFGELLKNKRTAAGLTQATLAALSGVSRSQLIRWEAGDTTNPKLSALAAVGQHIDMTLDEAIVALESTPTPQRSNMVSLTMHVRKEVMYDREELAALLNTFMGWAQSNDLVALTDANSMTRVDIIEKFIVVMTGENID